MARFSPEPLLPCIFATRKSYFYIMPRPTSTIFGCGYVERWMNNQEENIVVIPSSVLILNMYRSLSLKAHLKLIKTKYA